MVNQRLLPPTFPRYTEIRTKEATVDYLETLLDRLITAMEVTRLATYISALVRIKKDVSFDSFGSFTTKIRLLNKFLLLSSE